MQSEELKCFFSYLAETGQNVFFYWRFYKSPNSMLDAENKKLNKDFHDNFFLSNHFCVFLDLILNDRQFVSKLDDMTVQELSVFLGKSVRFKNNPLITNNAHYFSNVFEKLEEFNDDFANQVVENLDSKFNEYHYGASIDDEKRFILDMIREDDYENSILANFSDLDERFFRAVLCENEFLEITSNWPKEELSKEVIANIIKIIWNGVAIKTYRHNSSKIWRSKLNDETIKNYDLKNATALINNLQKYQYSKKQRDDKQKQLKLVKFESGIE